MEMPILIHEIKHYLTYSYVEGLDFDKICRRCNHDLHCARPKLDAAFYEPRDRDEKFMVCALRRYDNARSRWSATQMGTVVGHLCVWDQDGRDGKAYFVTDYNEHRWSGLFFPQFGEIQGHPNAPAPPKIPLRHWTVRFVYARVPEHLANGAVAFKWTKAELAPGESSYFQIREGPQAGTMLPDPLVLPYHRETEQALRLRGDEVSRYISSDSA
ncbi:hypothetical protein GLOTRDRAFT_133225 [Gloeophyllum trabeum ATCC 11539]|uniref:Uncharacterized protein n=1 Tax=Gloeophyllum trabeum (strain ATCC 11539 / FP-39264 / Madison 617) TaxID=670483 RepID=S7PU70_GLOTA|nr:uncharacterized protein GLOTRDRAFT_133225 [Gloeophyllum trabeum ATCC 11539]EPQ51356.1 hypothetical protein GLOTRDRAFT_133225 [Gloeophyllum trabeum ATCC 11539]